MLSFLYYMLRLFAVYGGLSAPVQSASQQQNKIPPEYYSLAKLFSYIIILINQLAISE